uniref:Enhancer of rudimentary homolog n=1 Tax=Alexandrium catenella TaxID=2925 RepID=A0A7S1QRP8_ALECA
MVAGRQRGWRSAQGWGSAAGPRRTIGDKRKGVGPGIARRARNRTTGPSAGALPGGHTILLVQFQQRTSSRTYTEHDAVSGAMDSVCQMFEQALKLDGGESGSDTARYTPQDLWAFIDGLQDVGCLVYNTRVGGYRPHDREWIKRQVLEHLKGQVSSSA